MRKVDSEVAEQRKEKILQAIIYHYIHTEKPVSSQIINKDYEIDLSSASIRNIMVQLEKEGYLTTQHVSSGRMPTDKGYRWLVDSLMELQSLALEERRKIIEEYKSRINEFNELFVRTSHLLATLSNCAGFVIAPNINKSKLKLLHLMKLAEDRVLVIIVTHQGFVQHNVILTDYDADEHLLNDISQILNEKFKDSTISELTNKLPDIIHEIEYRHKELNKFIKLLSNQLNRQAPDDEIFLEGMDKMLPKLKIDDYKKLASFIQLIEHKKLLRQVIEEDFSKMLNTHVTIGKEHHMPELNDVSLIKTVYKLGEEPVGILGIIGPKRMEYPKMISLVNFVASTINKIFNKIVGEKAR